MLIDGKKIARGIVDELRAQPTPTKKMIAIVVGDDAALVHFLRLKGKFAAELGVRFVLKEFSRDVTTAELCRSVKTYSDDPDVGAVVIELPLPASIDAQAVLDMVSPAKDPECLTTANLQLFSDHRSSILPPAVATTRTIIESLRIENLAQKNAVVLGAGFLVGAPVAHWLAPHVRHVTVLRRASTDEERTRALASADIIVTGVGKKGLVTGDMIKPGVIVIDFGYPADVDFKSIAAAHGIVTPTPGGTGPILIAELFRNFYTLSVF